MTERQYKRLERFLEAIVLFVLSMGVGVTLFGVYTLADLIF